jgi:hypothetical protein
MKFISSIDENAPKDLYSYGGIYMHGKLQEAIGYDVPILVEGEITRGINMCDVQFPNGDTIRAIACIWPSKFAHNPWGMKGLILSLDEDKEEWDYVFTKYTEQSDIL